MFLTPMWQSIRRIHYLQLCSNCLSVLPSFWLLHRNEVVILRFACLGSLAICLTYCLISLAYVRIAEILVHIRHTVPEKHLSLSTLFSKWGEGNIWLSISKVILKCMILCFFQCFDSVIKELFFLRRHSFLPLNFTR